MKTEPGLERRVRRYFIVLTLILSTIYAGVLMMLAYVTEDAMIGRLLAAEVHYLEHQYRDTGSWPEPRLPFVHLYVDRQQLPEAVSAAIFANPGKTELFTADERHYHIRHLDSVGIPPALLVAEVSSLLVVTRGSPAFLMMVAAVFVVLLLLALWFARHLAKRTVQPLLERESQFTRDVSHELRTPLTVLKNSLALQQRRELAPGEMTELRLAVQHMEATVTTLLALARDESLTHDSLALRATLEDAVLAQHQALESAHFEVELEVAQDCRASGNQQLAALLFGNLIENALRHAGTPRLDIELREGSLVFTNRVGVDVPQAPTDAAVRSVGGAGLGLGLFLCRRIAEKLGWPMRVSTDDGLFRIILQISP